jgi:hypothetical protein
MANAKIDLSRSSRSEFSIFPAAMSLPWGEIFYFIYFQHSFRATSASRVGLIAVGKRRHIS